MQRAMTGITQFPILAIKNRQIVEQSTKVGCFHCLQIFDAKEISCYTDNDKTVICPKCGVDSVVGDACGFKLTEQILKTAKQFWYEKR
jgi:Zn finger protein HypA/HybF involved in hydrogenase expression